VIYVAYWGPGALPTASGLFLRRDGTTTPLVLPGDKMPGGGRFIRVRGNPSSGGINDADEVGFIGAVRLDDGTTDQRLYRWSPRAGVQLLAAPGMQIPGAGTLASVIFGGQIDADGHVLLAGSDTDGRWLLLRAGAPAAAPSARPAAHAQRDGVKADRRYEF
jgi:hypothetical protein